MPHSKIPFFYFLLAIIPPLTGAINFVVAKGSTNEIGPITLLFWRWSIAWITLLPFTIRHFLKDLPILRQHLPIITLSSFTGIALFNGLIYTALNYTTSINSSIIANTFPIFTIVISYLVYKDTIDTKKTISILLALLGTVIIMTNGNLLNLGGLFNNYGDLVALCGAMIFGLYSVLLRNRPTNVHILSFTFATSTIGILTILPFFILETLYGMQTVYNVKTISTILTVGVLVSVIGLLCWTVSISKLGAFTASLIFYLAPVFSIIFSQLFLSEELTKNHLIGLSLVLLGINFSAIIHLIKRIFIYTKHSLRRESSVDI